MPEDEQRMAGTASWREEMMKEENAPSVGMTGEGPLKKT